MTAITNALERDRAAARLDRLAALQLHAAALLEAAIDNPGGDPLLADVGRYVGSVLNEFGFDLAAEQETLRQLIAAWDQSWEPRHPGRRWFTIHFETDNLRGDTAEFASSRDEAERQFRGRDSGYLKRVTLLEIDDADVNTHG